MKNVIIFVAGAVVGAGATWAIVDARYKKLAEEEIEAVREVYRNKKAQLMKDKDIDEDEPEPEDDNKNEPNATAPSKWYNQVITDLGYNTDEDVEKVDLDENEGVAPYVISPDEYGNTQFYDAKVWTYYKDGVLADEDDEIVGDYENIIGDALKHMGEFEDDCVHVRNENTECDYEILQDNRTYDEVVGEDN